MGYRTGRKDARDRGKGIQRLEKRFAKGKITKASVNNKDYNRLLTLEGETTVAIDKDKIAEDKRLDGLKWHVTNSNLKIRKPMRITVICFLSKVFSA